MSLAEILKSMKCAPRLEKSNHNRWSTHFLDTLSIFDIDSYLLNNKPQLSSKGQKNIPEGDEKIHKQDKIIRIAISQLVPDIVYHLVDPSYISKQCWENLKQFYCPNAIEDVNELLQEYWGLTVEDDIDVDEFVQKLADIRGKISLIDRALTPSDSSMKKRILSHFIKCCGGFFMSTAISLRESSVTLHSTVTSIRASQGVYRELHHGSIVALAEDSQVNISTPSKVKFCAYCKRRGHVREICFLWIDTPDRTRWAAKNLDKAAKVRKLRKKSESRKVKGKSSQYQLNLDDAEDESSQLGAWVMEEHALITHEYSSTHEVVLDTGATNHIFNDRSMFVSMIPSSKSVTSASGHSIPVSGVGRVQFKVFDYVNKHSSKLITMEGVWYVPSCTKNLLSGVRLFENGFKIDSSNEGLCAVSRSGSVVATARPRSGLFYFNTKSSSYVESPCSPIKSSYILLSETVIKSATELMHRRFAHIGAHSLNNIDVSKLKLPALISKNVQDFRVDKKILNSCDVCNLCKQVEKINRGPSLKSSNILDLVHSDTWSKCRDPGILGSYYFVTFIDDYSRKCEVYLMKNKAEVPKHFDTYKEIKERQIDRTMKALRFDGGSEYKTIKFSGIIQQISAPYTQHQNGVAERFNRTLVTMARCMLSHAQLLYRFWDAAVLTACYLRNRVPSHNGGITPYENLNGSTPNLLHLRVWGCVCYALIDEKDPHRYKLSHSSYKGIFVGYCESSTQYRVYIPSRPGKNKVIVSANVKFLEDTFWDWNNSLPGGSNHEIFAPFDSLADENNIDTEESSSSESSSPRFNVPGMSLTSPPELSDLEEPQELPDTIDSMPEPPELTSEIEAPNLRSDRICISIPPRSAWQPKPHALEVGVIASIPQSYSEAISGPESIKWRNAIDDELRSLKEKGVFRLINHIPHERKPIGSRWVFTIKPDGRFKARLVAKGFSQISGIDYYDTYAPTLRMDSLRILFAVSTLRDWEIHHIDVKIAYLEGDWNEEIYMKCPEGIKITKYVKVEKALYGLKQSGRAWNKKLNNKLCSIGFKKSEYDHCVYIHSVMQIVIGVYVDNLVICGKIIKQVEKIKKQLSLFFPIKDLGEIRMVIGWEITRDRVTRTLNISQAKYLNEKIKSFGLETSTNCNFPLADYNGILPRQDGENSADESAYASAIGSLGYATSSTRPDISFATCQLGKFNISPTTRHWDNVCRVLRYVKGTINNLITYNFGPSNNTPGQESKIVIYSDSDFASDSITRQSVSGYVAMLGGGPVCWQSKRPCDGLLAD